MPFDLPYRLGTVSVRRQLHIVTNKYYTGNDTIEGFMRQKDLLVTPNPRTPGAL